MIGDLFDSPWKVLIFAALILVLFGAKKMPEAARSLGRSMRILKAEVSGLHEDETAPGSPVQGQADPAAAFPQVQLAAAQPQPDHQSQIDALQQQVRDLQRAATMDASASAVQAGVAASEPGRTQQPG
ncbi:MAG: Sec-independent protein translocase subunit TatA [Streptosporangiaceae bacterium]